MYPEECIDYLNHYGTLHVDLLRMKYKVTTESAKEMLKEILDDYENVLARSAYQIYIEGRELQHWKPKLKPKQKKVYIKKRPQWKDVTKP